MTENPELEAAADGGSHINGVAWAPDLDAAARDAAEYGSRHVKQESPVRSGGR